MSNSTISTKVTLRETTIGEFMYTHQVMIESLSRVEIVYGFERLLGLTPKFNTI